ncbi:uncharacterized protein LOC107883779 [Acyrthosiphon pisum]|uniref:Uncharacterized protein n=1 Tax=Acyrthosiphon pisum TaxID=7029 RepID=A0A8R2D3S4_ACYPI|nr:uncharacterized protein LOC107883779 [Acyrthosiphon pisum]|eukprot:XP_016659946.1 PREDICTED: uncharacterized protein LOC107883779 [Acyrthosiphon pisum]
MLLISVFEIIEIVYFRNLLSIYFLLNVDMLIFRTRTATWNRWDNAFDWKSEQNFSTINLEPIQRDDTVVGRLSRQIENNLKAPSDFRNGRGAENLPEVAEIRRSEYSGDTLVPVDNGGVMVDQGRPGGIFKIPTARTPRCSDRLTGKITLDKYFRVTKTSRRLRDLNFGGFSAAASDMKSPVERPSSDTAAQQRTVGLGDEKLSLTNRFFNRDFEDSRDTGTRQRLRYYFPSISKDL